MNKLSFQTNIIKILILGVLILIVFTIFNVTNSNITNVERLEPCQYFLNPFSEFAKDIEINKSDKGLGEEAGDKKLEAMEFCLKRS